MDETTRAQIILSVKNEGQGAMKEMVSYADQMAKALGKVGDPQAAKQWANLSTHMKTFGQEMKQACKEADGFKQILGGMQSGFRSLQGVVGTVMGAIGGFSLAAWIGQSIQLWQQYESAVGSVAMRLNSVAGMTGPALQRSIHAQERSVSGIASRYYYGKMETQQAFSTYVGASGHAPPGSLDAIMRYARATGADPSQLAGMTGNIEFMTGRRDTQQILAELRAVSRNTGMSAQYERSAQAQTSLMAALQSQNPLASANLPELAGQMMLSIGNVPGFRGEQAASALSSMSSATAAAFNDPAKQSFLMRSGFKPYNIVHGLTHEGDIQKVLGGLNKEYGSLSVDEKGNASKGWWNAFAMYGASGADLLMKIQNRGGKATKEELEQLTKAEDPITRSMVAALKETNLGGRLDVLAKNQDLQLTAGDILNRLIIPMQQKLIDLADAFMSGNINTIIKEIKKDIAQLPLWLPAIAGAVMLGSPNPAVMGLGAVMLGGAAGTAFNDLKSGGVPMRDILTNMMGGGDYKDETGFRANIDTLIESDKQQIAELEGNLSGRQFEIVKSQETKNWEAQLAGLRQQLAGHEAWKRSHHQGPGGWGFRAQAQSGSFGCGQTSVAMAVNAVTGKSLTESDIAKKYGYRLDEALNSESAGSGYTWGDKDFSSSDWSMIEENAARGEPSIMGMGGHFSASGNGHYVTIISVDGDKVTYADPNGGGIYVTTKADFEQTDGHPLYGKSLQYVTGRPKRRAAPSYRESSPRASSGMPPIPELNSSGGDLPPPPSIYDHHANDNGMRGGYNVYIAYNGSRPPGAASLERHLKRALAAHDREVSEGYYQNERPFDRIA